jgi:hypothetical protein
MKLRFLLIAAVALLAVGATAAQASAPPTVTTAGVIWLPDSGMSGPVAGASSTIVRTDDGANYSLTTSGLPVGHAITLWLVIFNNPAGCAVPYACTPGDLIPFGGSGAAEDSVLWGAGRVIGPNGTANYAGHISIDKTDRPTAPDNLTYLYGPGLTDPRGAHFLLVVHDHGVAQPGIVDQQIHSFGIGCPGTPGTPEQGNNCLDLQASYNAP